MQVACYKLHSIMKLNNCCRFFRQLLAFFCVHQMALSLFRFIAALGRTLIVANTLGTFTLLLVFVLGGFIIARGEPQLFFSPICFISQMKCMTVNKISLVQVIVSRGTVHATLVIYFTDDIEPWMIWGYYASPMMYGQNAIAINEFLDKRWSAVRSSTCGENLFIRFSCETAFIYLLCSLIWTPEFLSLQLGKLFSGLEACIQKTIGTGFVLVLS